MAHAGSRRKRFLFPVRALSKVFRGKVLAALAMRGPADRSRPNDTSSLLRTLHGTPWVVYAKPPFGGPAQVLAYLGRYTHRIAISNERILALRDGDVHFRWRDYADHHRAKVMALPAEEFLRRFLLHVVPGGFQRIRHFGLLANRRRAQALSHCRALLHAKPRRPRYRAKPLSSSSNVSPGAISCNVRRAAKESFASLSRSPRAHPPPRSRHLMSPPASIPLPSARLVRHRSLCSRAPEPCARPSSPPPHHPFGLRPDSLRPFPSPIRAPSAAPPRDRIPNVPPSQRLSSTGCIRNAPHSRYNPLR